jgi:hypothetical protein
MNKLYHLHIPRTSGTGILYAIHKSFYMDREKKGLLQEINQVPEIFEFSYDHKKMADWPAISGHFAINPIIENYGKIDTFSIVREPVDHFVSIAAYRALSSKKTFNHETLDEFLEGVHNQPFGCRLFSSHGNLQTHMLACRTVSISKILGIDNEDNNIGLHRLEGIWFVEEDMPKSDEQLISKIEQIQLFELNDRENINKYLKYQFKTKFDVNFVGVAPEKTNSSIRNGITPTPEQKREILKRSHFDLVVYEYVRSKRK